jgi:ATP-binding cassette subfamily B (MDR/TAP) protein 1
VVTRVRKTFCARDKRWFDQRETSSVRMVQILVKDGDDARNLIGVILGQFFVTPPMLGVGLVWALVTRWRLTLVGFAISPVFTATMAVQAGLVAKCEARNKLARESVEKGYYKVFFCFLPCRFVLTALFNLDFPIIHFATTMTRTPLLQ